jgi:hypothetical protein
MNKRISILFALIVLMISSIITTSSIYYSQKSELREYEQSIEREEYTRSLVIKNIEYGVLLFLIICIPVANTKIKVNLKLKKKDKIMQVYPIKAVINHRLFYSIIIILISIVIMIDKLKLDEYITYRLETASISENLKREE